MSEKRLVYLVRSESEVTLQENAPDGLEVSSDGNYWTFKRNQTARPMVNEIANCHGEFLYCSGWTGPIGVYDIYSPGHLQKMLDQMFMHRGEIARYHLKLELNKAFGEDAAIAYAYMQKIPMAQHAIKLTDKQEAYILALRVIQDLK
jgi:hypothetical protein